jgi:hypothetical protein
MGEKKAKRVAASVVRRRAVESTMSLFNAESAAAAPLPTTCSSPSPFEVVLPASADAAAPLSPFAIFITPVGSSSADRNGVAEAEGRVGKSKEEVEGWRGRQEDGGE